MSSNEVNPGSGLSAGRNPISSLPTDTISELNDLTGQPLRKNPTALGSHLGLPLKSDDRTLNSGLNQDEVVTHTHVRTNTINANHVYGDEFESGILPIDYAVHIAGQGLNQVDKAVEAGTQIANDAIKNIATDLSEAIHDSINTVQQNWNAPDNKFHQALKKMGDQTSKLFRRGIADLSAKPEVQELGNFTITLGQKFLGKTEELIQTAQAATESWLDNIHGESFLEVSQLSSLPSSNRFQQHLAFDSAENINAIPLTRDQVWQDEDEQGTNSSLDVELSQRNVHGTLSAEHSESPEEVNELDVSQKKQTPSRKNTSRNGEIEDSVMDELRSKRKELKKQIRALERVDESEVKPRQLQKQINQLLDTYQQIQKQDEELRQQQDSLSEKLDLLNQRREMDVSELGKLRKHISQLKEQLNDLSQQRDAQKIEYQKVSDQLASLTPQAVLHSKIQEVISEESNEALQVLLQLEIPDIDTIKRLITKNEKSLSRAESKLQVYKDLLLGNHLEVEEVLASEQEQIVSNHRLVISILNAALISYNTEMDELLPKELRLEDSVEDLDLKIDQLNRKISEINSNLTSAQSAANKTNEAVQQLSDELSGVQSHRNFIHEELQDFLDRFSLILPEAELQIAIAQRLQYVQNQLDNTTDPKERATFDKQFDWLKLQQSFAIENSSVSLEEWSELIEDLKQRKGDLEKNSRETFPLQRYIHLLSQAASDNDMYLPSDLGQLRDRLDALSQDQTKLNTVISSLQIERNELKATKNRKSSTHQSDLLQQNAQDIRLFQQVAAALNYEASQLVAWVNFLDHITPPTQSIEQQHMAWQQTESSVASAINTLIQRSQDGSHTQADIDAFKASIQAAVGNWQGLSSVEDQKLQLQSLIDIGLLVTELQPDFFKNHVTTKVSSFVEHLQNWNQSLSHTTETLKQLLQQLQPTLTTDKNFSQFIQEQLNQIAEIQAQVHSSLQQFQTTLDASEQALSISHQQQQIDLEVQLKQNEQQIAWVKEQQAIERKIQSGSFDPEDLYEDLQQYLRQLMRDSANNLENSHNFGQELLRLREKQSNQFERLAKRIQDELLTEYGDRELAQSSLRDSMTIVATLRTAYDGFAQTVNALENEIEVLQLDVGQGKDVQQKIADLQKHYVESGQAIKEEVDRLQSQIASQSNHAAEKLQGIEEKIDGLYLSAEAADREAERLENDAKDAKRDSQENRKQVALAAGEGKYQIVAGFVGKVPVDAYGNRLSKYIEDPSHNWENSGPEWKVRFVEWRESQFKAGYFGYEGKEETDDYWTKWKENIDKAQVERENAQKWREAATKLEQSHELEFWKAQQAQWQVVTEMGEEIEKSVEAIQHFLNVEAPAIQEEASRASKTLQEIEQVFPLINQRFAEVTQEFQSAQTNLDTGWNAYDNSADLHLKAVFNALTSYTRWNDNNLEYRARLDEIEAWANQQSNALLQTIDLVKSLKSSIQDQLTKIDSQHSDADGDEQDALERQKAGLQRSLNLIGNTSNAFNLQQDTLENLQQLEASHESTSVAEQRLMQSYLDNPNTDEQVLRQKLLASREALAEGQRLAEQALNSNNSLHTFTLDFQDTLLETRNEYIQATKQLQPLFDELDAAIAKSIQSAKDLRDEQENLNNLTRQIEHALNEAIANGDREADALRKIATNQGMEAAAQLYVRNYEDLITSTKKKYRPLLDEYLATASRLQKDVLSTEEQQHRDQLIIRIRTLAEISDSSIKSIAEQIGDEDVFYRNSRRHRDEARQDLAGIAQSGTKESILVRLINLEIDISKELERSKNKDEEARHLLAVIHDRGFLAAAEAMQAYIEQDLQTAKPSRQARYGSLLEHFEQNAQHYHNLEAEARANADEARLARVTIEAQLDPKILENPEYTDIANVVRERLQIDGNFKGLHQQQAEIQIRIGDLQKRLEDDLDNQEQIQQELDAALLQQQIVGTIIQKTEQVLNDLLTIYDLDRTQASLEQKIASDWATDLQQTIAEGFQQDLLENHHQQLGKVNDILQIEQQNAEVQLQAALNSIRHDLGMAPLIVVPSQTDQQQQMQILLKDLRTLRSEQPELPENLQILLSEVEGDLNIALKGEEASAIQTRLTNLIDELTVQNQSFMDEINQLNVDNENDMKLLGLLQGEGLPEGKLQELDGILGEIRDSNEVFKGLMDSVQNLRLKQEINSQRIDAAEQMIDLSAALDAQSHHELTGEISSRIEERRTAGKRLWGKIKMGLTIVAGAIATGLTLGNAAPIAALAVSLAVGAMNAIDGAVQGDWMGFAGGLLSIGGAVTGILGKVGTIAATTVKKIEMVEKYAMSTYRTIKASIEGDDWLGVLEAAGGLISVANSGLSETLSSMSEIGSDISQGALNTLEHIPKQLYSSIKAIKSGDWLKALDGLFHTAIGLGQNFMSPLGYALKLKDSLIESIGQTIGNVGKFGKTGLIFAKGVKNRSFIDFEAIVDLFKDDIRQDAEKKKRQSATQAQNRKSDHAIRARKSELEVNDPLAGLNLETGEPEAFDISTTPSDVNVHQETDKKSPSSTEKNQRVEQDENNLNKMHRQQKKSRSTAHAKRHRDQSYDSGSDDLISPHASEHSNLTLDTLGDELLQGGFSSSHESSNEKMYCFDPSSPTTLDKLSVPYAYFTKEKSDTQDFIDGGIGLMKAEVNDGLTVNAISTNGKVGTHGVQGDERTGLKVDAQLIRIEYETRSESGSFLELEGGNFYAGAELSSGEPRDHIGMTFSLEANIIGGAVTYGVNNPNSDWGVKAGVGADFGVGLGSDWYIGRDHDQDGNPEIGIAMDIGVIVKPSFKFEIEIPAPSKWEIFRSRSDNKTK